MGPVEAMSRKENALTLVVLGQAFEIADGNFDSFALGDFVVAGTHPEIGVTAYHVGSPYVAGVSRVQLKAPVTGVDVAVGTASLGGATVDYTRLLSANPEVVPEVGASFSVVGIQPVAKGVVLAGPNARGTVGCSALDGRL
jgi:hypothetical protein